MKKRELVATLEKLVARHGGSIEPIEGGEPGDGGYAIATIIACVHRGTFDVTAVADSSLTPDTGKWTIDAIKGLRWEKGRLLVTASYWGTSV